VLSAGCCCCKRRRLIAPNSLAPLWLHLVPSRHADDELYLCTDTRLLRRLASGVSRPCCNHGDLRRRPAAPFATRRPGLAVISCGHRWPEVSVSPDRLSRRAAVQRFDAEPRRRRAFCSV